MKITLNYIKKQYKESILFSLSILRYYIKTSKIFNIFWGKYFGNFKNGQKKCPKIENPKTVLQKKHFCDHN